MINTYYMFVAIKEAFDTVATTYDQVRANSIDPIMDLDCTEVPFRQAGLDTQRAGQRSGDGRAPK